MIEKSQLTLLPVDFADVHDVHSVWADESATLYTNFPYIPDIEGCRIRLANVLSHYSKSPLHFGPYTIRSLDGTFLGLCGGDVANAENLEYEIWYFIHRSCWGRKVATRAVRELLRVMSGSGRVNVVKAKSVVDNEPSWRFLQSLGFKRTATLPDGHKKEGRVFDCYVYSKNFGAPILAATD